MPTCPLFSSSLAKLIFLQHEYTKYGFRKLLEGRCLDIIQPDVMWVGGLTELLKVTAQAAAYDTSVVPHASGPYSYHYVISQSNTPFQEYLANSPDGQTVLPVFGDLFIDEVIPVNGKLELAKLDKPGFGLVVNPAAKLVDARRMLEPGVAGVGMTMELDAPGPLPSSTSAGFVPAKWETTRSTSVNTESTSISTAAATSMNSKKKGSIAESSQKGKSKKNSEYIKFRYIPR